MLLTMLKISSLLLAASMIASSTSFSIADTPAQTVTPIATPADPSSLTFMEIPMPDVTFYDRFIQAQCDTIVNRQLPSGAIAMYDNAHWLENTINPYFAAHACMGLLDAGQRFDVVKRHIEWFFRNMNHTPDHLGVTGTIYDFAFDPVTLIETPKYDYDSSDAYAGTMLTVLRTYCEKSNDREFIAAHAGDIKQIYGALIATMDEGLTFSKVNYPVKYLMDNAEAAVGLESAAWLFWNVLGETALAEQSASRSQAIMQGIEQQFWSEDLQKYSVEANVRGKEYGDWYDIYPGASCQLFPGMLGLIDADSDRNRTLLQQFSREQPDWIELRAGDAPWALVAYAYARSGDFDTATRFLENVEAKSGDWLYGYPWHCGEAGFSIRAAVVMRNATAPRNPYPFMPPIFILR